MKNSGDLKRADRYFGRGKYAHVIRLLEPQIFRYRENAHYYYLLGVSCLKVGDVGGSVTYLKRSIDIRPDYPNSHLALAVAHLRRREVDKGLAQLLSVIDSEPGNRHARRALALVRRHPSPEEVSELVDRGKIDRILPIKARVWPLVAAWILVAGVLATAAYIFVPLILEQLQSPARNPEVAELSIAERDLVAESGGSFELVLTENEITSTFQAAKRYFSAYRDNLAQREINRIMSSNASVQVKAQAETIRQYISVPDFTTIKDSFTYDEVAVQPFLYENCYVTWKGKTSNLDISSDSISFDLLVGYEDETVLEGIVPVRLDFSVNLDQGAPVEVLGRITLQADNSFALEGISLHKLLPK